MGGYVGSVRVCVCKRPYIDIGPLQPKRTQSLLLNFGAFTESDKGPDNLRSFHAFREIKWRNMPGMSRWKDRVRSMASLIINLAVFFLVPFFLLPCLVILAMLLRGVTYTHRKHKPAGLESRRATDLTGIAAISTSHGSASLLAPLQ